MMGYYGGGLFGGVFMVLVWAGIIFFIVWVVREAVGGRKENSEKGPREILNERYAKGEITKEEFESKKKDLKI